MPNNKIIRNDDGEKNSKLLDYLGASEDMRQEHQKHGKENELLQTFAANLLLNRSVNNFVFGSTSEGTYLSKVNSNNDIDCLMCNNSYPVITSPDECTPGVLCFMIIHDKSQRPGYVKLQPFVNKEALTEHSAHLYGFNTGKTDGKGRLCLDQETAYTEFCYHKSKYFSEKHGPAYTTQSHLNVPTDIVPAFRCASIPFLCSSWISHYMNCVWPSKALIEDLIKLGCFVVPVSHIHSPQPDLEWRVSFSLQERQIMFSLTPVQHKCYVFLKTVQHLEISPLVGDAISTYHLKTSIFHLKTLTANGFWSENNFCICIRMCFLILLSWLDRKFCPNWFIPEQNLFEKHVDLTNDKRNILWKTIYGLAFSYDFRYLLSPIEEVLALFPLEIDQRLVLKFRTMFEREKYRRLLYSVQLEKNEYNTLTEFLKMILAKMKKIPKLTSEFHSTKDSEIPKRLLTLMFKSALMQTYGSLAWTNEEWLNLLKNQSLSLLFTETFLERFNHSKRVGMSNWDSNIILDCQKRHFNESGSYQNDRITSDTVLATVMYMSGHDIEADRILSSAESNDRKDVFTLCHCNNVPVSLGCYSERAMDEEDILLHIAPCVIFTVHNLPIIPEALYFELIRTKLPDILTTEFWNYNESYFWAVVDARIYLYFLRYLVFKKLNNRNNQKEAFKRLKRAIIKADRYGSDIPIIKAERYGPDDPFYHFLSYRRYVWYCLGHIETAFNLLGWIYVQEGLHDAAVYCFTSSWKKKRNINAAKWHMALMLFDSMI